MLRPGNWNALHTHQGSTYSGTLYIADDIGCTGKEQVAGKIAFIPGAPDMLQHEQPSHVLQRCDVGGHALTCDAKRGVKRRHSSPDDRGVCLHSMKHAQFLVFCE